MAHFKIVLLILFSSQLFFNFVSLNELINRTDKYFFSESEEEQEEDQEEEELVATR